MDRAAIFIDGSNVIYQQKSLSWSIDWEKLIHFFSEDYKIISARYYTALKEPPSNEQKGFHRMLASTGYALKTKKLKKIYDKETGDTFYKGNLDIELVIDALTTVDQYDVFILFSGDGDFVPLIRALRQQRKVVKAFSTRGYSSIDLVSELGMDFKDIDEYRSRLEHKNPSTNSKRKPQKSSPSGYDKMSDYNESKFPDIGDEFLGTVQKVTSYGVFLENEFKAKALLHISNMDVGYIEPDLESIFKRGDKFRVKIEDTDTTKTVNEISVSLIDEKFKKELTYRIDNT